MGLFRKNKEEDFVEEEKVPDVRFPDLESQVRVGVWSEVLVDKNARLYTDINFYDYWHSTTPMDFPDSVTLHLENGTKYFYFRYNYSPLDYNPYTNDVVLDSKDNKDKK